MSDEYPDPGKWLEEQPDYKPPVVAAPTPPAQTPQGDHASTQQTPQQTQAPPSDPRASFMAGVKDFPSALAAMGTMPSYEDFVKRTGGDMYRAMGLVTAAAAAGLGANKYGASRAAPPRAAAPPSAPGAPPAAPPPAAPSTWQSIPKWAKVGAGLWAAKELGLPHTISDWLLKARGGTILDRPPTREETLRGLSRR